MELEVHFVESTLVAVECSLMFLIVFPKFYVHFIFLSSKFLAAFGAFIL